MENKLLTIGIPVYNTELYLERCLQSVVVSDIAAQIEVIVVNDGSTDGSLSILRRWEERFPDTVRVIDKMNGGHGSAINCAVKAANGKYFKLLDSDDWFDSECYLPYLDSLQETDADIVVNRMVGEHTYIQMQDFDKKQQNVEYGIVLKFEEINFDYFLPMAGITYKTVLLKNNFQEITEKTFYVDNEYITYPMINMNTVLFLDMCLYHYFIGRPEQSVNLRSRIQHWAHLKRVAGKLLDFMGNTQDDLTLKKRKYLENIVCEIARGYTGLLLKYNIGVKNKDKYILLKEFTDKVKTTNKEIYIKLCHYSVYKLYLLSPWISLYSLPVLEYLRRSLNKRV